MSTETRLSKLASDIATGLHSMSSPTHEQIKGTVEYFLQESSLFRERTCPPVRASSVSARIAVTIDCDGTRVAKLAELAGCDQSRVGEMMRELTVTICAMTCNSEPAKE